MVFFCIYLRLIPSSNGRNTTGTYFITAKRAMLIDDLAKSMKSSSCAKSVRKELGIASRDLGSIHSLTTRQGRVHVPVHVQEVRRGVGLRKRFCTLRSYAENENTITAKSNR